LNAAPPRESQRLEGTGRFKEVQEMAGKTSDRELIDTGTDKRYVRRDGQGRFRESDDVGRSLSQDVKHEARTKVKSGQGDRGDQKRK
jgi:hypothetical protein